MKKILFATTALVATASVAAADVTFSGFGALAAISNEAHSDDGFKVQSNIDIFVNATVETDNGVTFSADINMEDLSGTNTTDTTPAGTEDDVAPGKSAGNSVTSVVSVSGGFGKIAFGNTDGALDRSTTEVYRTVGADYELWGGVIDNSDAENILRYEYTIGGLRIAASNSESDDANGFGVNYTHAMGDMSVNVGAAYETSSAGAGEDITAVSLGMDMGNGLGVRVAYWESENDAGATVKDQTDVGIQYKAGDLTLAAAYMMNDVDNSDNYTVFAEYGLGAGVTAFGGVGTRGATELDVASFGVRFNF
ncbi:porin [Lentibacter algarum]|uniref:porin n=1 Tax=Lentibacter algarum TaxID=576131 RepID=UPI0024902B36|nr:porin [Lentibacter algarum]